MDSYVGDEAENKNNENIESASAQSPPQIETMTGLLDWTPSRTIIQEKDQNDQVSVAAQLMRSASSQAGGVDHQQSP